MIRLMFWAARRVVRELEGKRLTRIQIPIGDGWSLKLHKTQRRPRPAVTQPIPPLEAYEADLSNDNRLN